MNRLISKTNLNKLYVQVGLLMLILVSVAKAQTTPSDPTITSINTVESTVTINFSAPTSDGGASITNYEYSTDGGLIWMVYSPVTTTSPLTVTNLSLGATYNVKIRAVNTVGAGAASNSISAVILTAGCSYFDPADFQISGKTTYLDKVYTLTESKTNQSSSIWNKNKLNLDKDFDIKTRFYFGDNEVVGTNGADGIVLVLQNVTNNPLSPLGTVGGSIGYEGITPSFAVEFDTYYNGSFEPIKDHIAIIANGQPKNFHSAYATPYEVAQMEDGQWHTAQFVWKASTKKFEVWFDGAKVQDITLDLKTSIFSGQNFVYWGFTSATGGDINLQKVEIESYCYDERANIKVLTEKNNLSTSFDFCSGTIVTLQANSSSAYQWYKNGIAIDGATARELEVSQTGNYTVMTNSLAQVNTTSEPVTITFLSYLPVIKYFSSPIRIEKNKLMDRRFVTSTGFTPTSYSISPALPEGVTFDPTNGMIQGTPKVESAPTTYTVTATESRFSGCSGTTTISLEVFSVLPPSSLSYTPSTQTVRTGTTITAMTPTSSGGLVESYTISPSLPSGVTINQLFGTISGTPSQSLNGSFTYTVSATNSGGTATTEITLVFDSAPSDISISNANIVENSPSGSLIGTLSTTDLLGGNVHTYSFASGLGSTDNAMFTIEGNQLKTAAATFDYETKASYSVRIKTTNAGGLSYEKVITVTVLNVNEYPSNLFLSTTLISENNLNGAVIGNLLSVDIDRPDMHTYTLVSGTGSTDNALFTIEGNQLKANVTFDYETKNNYTIRIRTTDAGGLSFEKVMTITVLDANDAPINLDLSKTLLNEINPIGTVVGDLSSTDIDNNDTHTYTLVSGTGSTDNNLFIIEGNQLKTSATFEYDTKNTYTIRVRTTDSGGLNYEKLIVLTVINPNEAPTNLTLSSTSINENNSTNAIIGSLSSTDADAGDTFTYTLVSGTGSTDNALFTLDGNNLKTTIAFDFEIKSSYLVRIRTTDAGGLSYEKSITITVNNENEAPTNITLSSTSINENNSTNAIIGSLSSTDTDAGDTFTYALVSGTGSTDNALFTIDGNNLKTTVAFDFESKNSYSVRIRTTDAGGLSYEKTVTITVTDVNDAPNNLATSQTSINENNATGAVIGALSSTDPDTGDTHTYSLVSGTGSADNALFTIDGNNLKSTIAFDFETKGTYSVRVRTTDAAGLTYEKSITITVLDVNEAPSNVLLSIAQIYEKNAIGAVIGSLSSTDQDAGDKHSYTLVSGDIAAFRISGNQLIANVVFDFTTKSIYDIVVKSTDAGGLTVNKAIRITILQSPVLVGSANLPRNNQSSATGQNVTISKGYSANLNLSASNIVKYAWSPSTGLSATNISNPIAKPSQTTTYTVQVTNAQGVSTEVYMTVIVLDDYNITPNNVLSPDGDGVNDFWTIENLSTYPNNEVKIFDKAGRVIFNVRNYQNNWNGQLNGETLHEGAYYYVINLGPGTRPKIGYITLFSNK